MHHCCRHQRVISTNLLRGALCFSNRLKINSSQKTAAHLARLKRELKCSVFCNNLICRDVFLSCAPRGKFVKNGVQYSAHHLPKITRFSLLGSSLIEVQNRVISQKSNRMPRMDRSPRAAPAYSTSVKRKLSTSTSPMSVSLSEGMTGRAMNDRVIKGA